MKGRYIEGDAFGEITSHEILIPFYVTAGSRTTAIRKLLNALRQTNKCPYQEISDRHYRGEIDEIEMARLEIEISADDPREMTGHWDWPAEFVELGMDDRI
jgi:hypothetical protein